MRPALVVILVVDQFRGDYVDKYGHQWRHGLRRLFDEGAYYTEAAYRYASTTTCAGHATIGTGATPQTHGMISNAWHDRALGRDVACTEDPSVTNVTYGTTPARTGDSSIRLATPTLADEMRAQLGVAPQVVTMSRKARAALTLAGHRSTLSTWFDGPRGFVTSPAMGVTGRVPFLERYLRPTLWKPTPMRSGSDPCRRPLTSTRTWARVKRGFGAAFPHRLAAPPVDGQVDPGVLRHVADEPVRGCVPGPHGRGGVADLKLGKGQGTDFLAVSFSTLDTVGHAYGPRSHEVQDVLVRLDETIGTLLAELDRQVGRDRYALALTADHGVSPIPQQMQALGLGGGLVDRKAVEHGADRALGGSVLDSNTGSEIYLSSDAAAKLAALEQHEWDAVRTSLEQVDGIARAWRTTDLLAGRYEAASDSDGTRGQVERVRGPIGRHHLHHRSVLVSLPDRRDARHAVPATTSTCRWCSPGRSSGAAGTPPPPARPTSRPRSVGCSG